MSGAGGGTDTGTKRYYGVAEALVVDINDPEKQGRVQVQFPWFDGDMTSEWCRVCQFYAGNDYGAFWIPEVGDEVLVGFVHGDMRIPVVLGGLYNGEDLPATHRADDKDEKAIKTRAGHQVVFDDKDGQEKITIVDKSGDNSIVIDTAQNHITIQAANGKVTIEGKNGVEIKSDQAVDVTAGAAMTLKGSTIDLN